MTTTLSAEPSTDDDWPTTTDGQTYVPRSGVESTGAPEPKSRTGAVLTSTVLCLLLTPATLVLVDYAVIKGWQLGVGAANDPLSVPIAQQAWIPMAVAAGLLLVVVLLGRVSGLGPLLAGLIFGAAPAVAAVLRPQLLIQAIGDIADPYPGFGTGLLAVSPVVLVLGALLIAVGLTGRWRGNRVPDPEA